MQLPARYIGNESIEFCYGHRVHGNPTSLCSSLHGHQGRLELYIEGTTNDEPPIINFEWLHTFIREHLDHKFILDLNDPWFNNIINLEPIWRTGYYKPILSHFKPRISLNTTDEEVLQAIPVYIADTKILAGYKVDASEMNGCEKEFFRGFFLTSFLPTHEHFAEWIYKITEAKLEPLNVRVSRVDWFETPKSRSSYSKVDK